MTEIGKIEYYDYMEDYDCICSVVYATNEFLAELFEVLVEEEAITPIYDEELELKDEKSYHMAIETTRTGFSSFWISQNTEMENNGEDADYLTENEYGDVEGILEIIRKKHY